MNEILNSITEILSSPAMKEVYATILAIFTFAADKLEILMADLISMLGV